MKVMDLFFIKKNNKYLTPNKTWTINMRKALQFEKEDTALKFLHMNPRIKADVVGLVSIHKISKRGSRTVVEFEHAEVTL